MNTKKTIIPIMTCFDKNYVIEGAVAFYSMLEHADKNNFYKIYVLHSDIAKEDQEKLIENIKEFSSFSSLEFINMENRFNDIWEKIYAGGHFSKEVMYKLLVASIFPEYEKLIVTDVDVVFLGDISKSYVDFDENSNDYLGVIKPIGKVSGYMSVYNEKWALEEIKKLGKFCGGYLVANLKAIRKDNMEEMFINSFIENGYRLNQMEQDVFNLCCYGKVKFLPLNYVVCSYMWDFYKSEDDFKNDSNYLEEEIKDAMNNPIQLHYATSVKPWKNPSCTKGEVWFEYLLKTNMVNDYIKILPTFKTEMPPLLTDSSNNLESTNKFLTLSFYKRNFKKIFNIRKNERIKYEEEIKEKEEELKKEKENTQKLLNEKEWFEKEYKKNKYETSLLIIDDFFPNSLSGFRYFEYESYLNTFEDVLVLSDNSEFSNEIVKYSEINKKNFTKVKRFDKDLEVKAAVCMLTFENNAYKYLPFIEKNKIPFVFTLYPGGGFSLNDSISDKKLKKIFESKYFKKVIVTQSTTNDYLISKNMCPKEKILFIQGGVVNIPSISIQEKKKYKEDKETFDICFVANKYMNSGIDKGYDTFIKVIKELVKKHDNIYAHVVGNFNEEDIDVSEISNKIKFYGKKEYAWFKSFYEDKDIIISPNIPFALGPGYFDGFPLTCILDAMLNNVGAFCTDELNDNKFYENKKDIVIIKPNVEEIIKEIEYYYNNPKELLELSIKGNKTTKECYGNQIDKRIEILKKILNKEEEK